jgi:hypothetical protein
VNHAAVTVTVLALHKRSGTVYYEDHKTYEVFMSSTDPELAAPWAATIMHGSLVDKFSIGVGRKMTVDLGGKWVSLDVSAHVTISCGHSLESLRGARDVALYLSLQTAEIEHERAMAQLQREVGGV